MFRRWMSCLPALLLAMAVAACDRHEVVVCPARAPSNLTACEAPIPQWLSRVEKLASDSERGIAGLDFDNDGNVDVGIWYGRGFGVEPGRGDGTFGAIVRTSLIDGNYGGVADIDMDGIIDLVTFTFDEINIWPGMGDGHFSATPARVPAPEVSQVRLADLDGDKQIDVIVASERRGIVNVLRNSGGGTFETTQTLSSGHPYSVAVAHVDCDERLDLLVATLDREIRVYWGEGAGRFVSGPSTKASVNLMTPADIDADGRTDLAVVDGPGLLVVLFGSGDGEFVVDSIGSIAGIDVATSLDVAPFRCAGHNDVVAQAGPNLVMLPSKIGREFLPVHRTPLGGNSGRSAVADFDKDGRPDITVGRYIFVEVLLGK
jgi:hypothetical protein